MSVYVCCVVCVVMCVCVNTPVCQGQRVRSAVFVSFGDSVSLSLEVSYSLLASEPQWSSCLPPPHWITGTHHDTLLLYRCWGRRLRPVHNKHSIDLVISSVLSRDFLLETFFLLLKIGFFKIHICSDYGFSSLLSPFLPFSPPVQFRLISVSY